MIYDMWTKLEVLLTFVTKAQFHFVRMTVVIFADKTGYLFNFFFLYSTSTLCSFLIQNNKINNNKGSRPTLNLTRMCFVFRDDLHILVVISGHLS